MGFVVAGSDVIKSQNRSSRICSNAPKSKFLSCGHLGVECPEDVEGRSAALQGRLDDDVIAVTREERPATLQDRRPTTCLKKGKTI